MNCSKVIPIPIQPFTLIRCNASSSEKAVLKIYNIVGQENETLVEGEVAAGLHE